MPLLKHGTVTDDPWVHVADGEDLPAGLPAIVSLDRWQAERDVLIARMGALGIRLESHQPPSLIRDDLDRFALVALNFPKFADGRAYSHARLLKERYDFAGEVRATGDVLRDQYRFLHRCGFDALEVSDAEAAVAWKEALGEFRHDYQPAARGAEPILRRRHRRQAA